MKKILLLVLVLVLFCSSAVAVELVRQKNAATYIYFPIVDADGDFVHAATGLDSEIETWADGSPPAGGFSDCTNEATHLDGGWYYLSLTQSEMNADYIAIQCSTTSAGAKKQAILIRTIVGDPLNLATVEGGIEISDNDADGRPDVNVEEWSEDNVPTPNQGGYPEVDLVYYEGTNDVDGEIQSEAADALTAYDPPTRAEATTDKAAIIAEVDVNETKIDAVDDYVDDEVATIKGKTDSLNFQGVAAGVALAVDVTRISTDATAANNAELFFDGTGYAGTNNVIPTVTTVSNEVTADAVKISGDAIAADNAELFFDGTGYAGTNNVIPSVTTVTGNVGGNVIGSVGSVVGAVGSVTAGVSLNAAEAGSLNAIAADVDNVVLYTDGDGSDGIDLDIKTIDDFVDTEVAALVAGVNVTSVAADAIEAGDFKTAAIDADAMADDAIDSSTVDPTFRTMIAMRADSGAIGASPWTAAGVGSVYVELIDSIPTAVTDVNKANFKYGGSAQDSIRAYLATGDSTRLERAAACGSGTGARTLTITILDDADSTTAISGFRVEVYDSSSGEFMRYGETNSNGIYTCSLDDETYTVHLTKTPWDLTSPRYFIITANMDSTFYASAFDPGSPASADMCRIYINDVRDIGAGEQAGCKLKIQIPSRYYPVRVGEAPVYAYALSATTDASGYVELDVYRSASLTAGDGTSTVKFDLTLEDPNGNKIAQRKDTEIPDQASWEIDWSN